MRKKNVPVVSAAKMFQKHINAEHVRVHRCVVFSESGRMIGIVYNPSLMPAPKFERVVDADMGGHICEEGTAAVVDDYLVVKSTAIVEHLDRFAVVGELIPEEHYCCVAAILALATNDIIQIVPSDILQRTHQSDHSERD